MSAYTDALKKGIQRVNDLTADYAECLEKGNHGMAAVVRGELTTARAHLQGMQEAGEVLCGYRLVARHDVIGGDRV